MSKCPYVNFVKWTHIFNWITFTLLEHPHHPKQSTRYLRAELEANKKELTFLRHVIRHLPKILSSNWLDFDILFTSGQRNTIQLMSVKTRVKSSQEHLSTNKSHSFLTADQLEVWKQKICLSMCLTHILPWALMYSLSIMGIKNRDAMKIFEEDFGGALEPSVKSLLQLGNLY